MNVAECIQRYKEEYSIRANKLVMLWLCPDAVIEPCIGGLYTQEVGLGSKLPELLKEANVVKHWVEDSILCIVYKNSMQLQECVSNSREDNA